MVHESPRGFQNVDEKFCATISTVVVDPKGEIPRELAVDTKHIHKIDNDSVHCPVISCLMSLTRTVSYAVIEVKSADRITNSYQATVRELLQNSTALR